jgi:hypothetical protein
MNVQSILDSVKELINKGNVTRIVVRKGKKELLNLPVNAGIIGVAVGLAWAKLATLAAVLATVGFGCKIEIVKDNGEVVDLMEEVKESVPGGVKSNTCCCEKAADPEAEFAAVVDASAEAAPEVKAEPAPEAKAEPAPEVKAEPAPEAETEAAPEEEVQE